MKKLYNLILNLLDNIYFLFLYLSIRFVFFNLYIRTTIIRYKKNKKLVLNSSFLLYFILVVAKREKNYAHKNSQLFII